jgi:hypothetical protein
MELYIIQKHDVVGAQFWREQMLNLQSEDLAVYCPFNRHRRKDPAQREGADDRNAPAIIAGLSHHGSFPP